VVQARCIGDLAMAFIRLIFEFVQSIYVKNPNFEVNMRPPMGYLALLGISGVGALSYG